MDRCTLLLPLAVSLLLATSLLLTGCDEGDDDDFVSGDDDDAVGDDDDAVGDDDDDFDENILEGVLVHPVTGEPYVDVPVTEFDTDPPNAANTGKGGIFVLEPQSFSPAQVWAGDVNYLEAHLVVSQERWTLAGDPIEVELWPEADGQDWLEDDFGYTWDWTKDVVIVEFAGPAAVPYLGALLNKPVDGSFVYDSAGNAVAGDLLLEDSARPWIVFVGVDPGPTELMVEPAEGVECTGSPTIENVGAAIIHVPVFCQTP